MSRPPLSYITAYLQFSIAIIFLLGYFALIAVVLLGKSMIQPDMLELAKTLIVGLSGALGLLFAFLYLRSRTDGPPDPATTTTQLTQTTTPTEAPHAIPTPIQPIPNHPIAGGMPDTGSPDP